MRNSDPYYLAIIEKPKHEVWYKNQMMGFNKVDSFIKKYGLDLREESYPTIW